MTFHGILLTTDFQAPSPTVAEKQKSDSGFSDVITYKLLEHFFLARPILSYSLIFHSILPEQTPPQSSISFSACSEVGIQVNLMKL